MKISVVIPCYNSEQSIKQVVDLVSDEMEKLGYDVEFVLINDNSKDGTFSVIREICRKDSRVKGLSLAKNFGQHNAIIAGLHYVTGDCVIGMDDDLQTHPSQLNKLISKYMEGYDIVFGVYPDRKFPWFRNIGSRFNSWTVKTLTDRPKEVKTSSFWIAKRFICDYVIEYPNPYPYISGLFFRITKNAVSVEVEHFKRQFGKSNYNLKALLKLWSSITNFSIVPLRAAMVLGMLFSAAGGIGAIAVVVNKLLNPEMALGWSSVMVTMLVLSGINFFCLGMIGEYVGRLFMSSNKAPQYAVREKLNC